MIRRIAVGVSLATTVVAAGWTLSLDATPDVNERAARQVPSWYAVARTAPASPVQLARVLAMVHVAVHDAVNAVEPRFETYAVDFTDRRADVEASAAAAAHRVLSGLFPAQQSRWDAALADALSSVPDGTAREAGLRLGAAVGEVILRVRADDGWNSVDPFTTPPQPGVWRPTPPAFSPMPDPQFQNVRPFGIASRDHIPLDPPPPLDSDTYRRDLEQVSLMGRDTSTTRTADQTHIAHFWFEPSYDGWTRVASLVQADAHFDLHQSARLYALVTTVVSDSLVSGWYWKRHYAFWRPITAIHESDPSWVPLRPTPSHPDYPSTHSVAGGAAAEVLRLFLRSDRRPFCMSSLTAIPQGSTRCFETFSQAQEENMASRVYAGIHFPTATVMGDRLGRRIGRFAFGHTLRPLRDSRRAEHDAVDSDASR